MNKMIKVESDLLDRFEGFEIPPQDFGHYDHLAVAYAMLERYDFMEACARCASTIQAMAIGAGAPKKFNATITIAFLSLIAERKSKTDSHNLKSFLASNPDLLKKDVLKTWYSNDRLHSALARKQFLLPDKNR